jgi:hypothetical protein
MLNRILLIIIILYTAAALWTFMRSSGAQQQMEEIESEVSLLRMRADADDLFIQGMHDDAFVLYRMIDSLSQDSLVHQRKQISLQSAATSDNDKLETLSRKLETTTALLRAYQAQQKDNNDYIVIEQTEELVELQEEINNLKDKLASAQKEIDLVKTKRGIIRFQTSKNGEVTYFGDLDNGKANGLGFGYWNSGSSYEGSWKDNLRHGKGSFQWADGERYEGEYVNDKRHGYGLYIAKAGKYEGQWLDDMRHGEGYLYEPGGKLKVHGIWEKDKLTKTIK